MRDVVETEKAGLDELNAEAAASGDQRRQEITEEVTAEKRMQLDLLPPDLAGQVQTLQNYEFTSTEAREQFEALMDELRRELMQSTFNQMAGAMSDVSPEQMQRMKDMFDALNRMIEQREAGEPLDPTFAQFMERFGDFSPAIRRTSTSCWSRWRSRWRRCSRCSTR